jgi:uncharacterized protein DUF1206
MQDGTAERLTRLGYACRGATYWLVGGLAVLAALGTGGAATDSKGALRVVLTTPFGSIWLALIALGLLCFAVWRMLQSIADADHLGRDWKALVRRTGYGVSALVHLALAGIAVSLTLGLGAAGARDGDASARDWTATVLSLAFGRWLVAAAGVIAAGVGLAFMYKAVTGRFAERLALDRKAAAWVLPLGRAGFVARGVVFVLVGIFLVQAAIDANAGEARGLAGALRALQGHAYGGLLLAATALGLFAFGTFEVAAAYYRRIDTSSVTAGSLRRGAASLLRTAGR